MTTPWNLPERELEEVIDRAQDDLASFRGSRVLVTGGTGFLGSWLVASLLLANQRMALGLRLVVLTRRPRLVPIESRPDLEIIEADVCALPRLGSVDLVIHGAANSSAAVGSADAAPLAMARTIVDGTRSVLEEAAGGAARVLFLSSGAVYGPQLGPVGEDAHTGPSPMDPGSVYGEAKRLAETLCAVASHVGDPEVVVARLFAFLGPRIPLDAHFAAGNFLRDALAGQTIAVRGDGCPRRSYLYCADLPEWCFALLARGRAGAAYNVGSPIPVTIRELAESVAAAAKTTVQIRKSTGTEPAPWYVPDTSLAERELGLRPHVHLDAAIHRTITWLRDQPSR